ncbi:MAG TPA: hypothetical protein VL424_00230, partial [Pararobbsia sp.]|nr:hypothetical protein [Pararobbsia sp.]
LEVIERDDAVEVRYRATCANPDDQRIDYRIECCVDAHRGVTCKSECTTSTDFLTARCGFCVLHPIEGVAGAPAIVEHGAGGIERGLFPLMIDPWQPFKDIRVIEHRLTDGRWLRCELDGDTFEMEDQRNWSDASFKTYSRPLELPWPYVLEAGGVFSQAVRVAVRDGDAAATEPKIEDDGQGEPVAIIELRNGPRTFPELGLLIAPDELDAMVRHIDVLRATAPQRVSLHYDPLAGHDIDLLNRYADLVRQIDARATLEYALPGVDAPAIEIAALATQIEQSGLAVSGLMISPSVHRQSNPPGSISPPCPPLDDVYASARRMFPNLRLSGGMLSYFTELNRKRPPLSMVDEVVHATCPIVHAADDTSVMQTLEAVAHITRSCRALIGAQPYSIGPLSIGMRQNPYGSRTMPNPDRQRVAMADDDPRQRGLFGAAWLVGYLAAVADADLASLTLGGMTGPRGYIDARGRPYPIAAVATTLALLGGHARIDCVSTGAGGIAAFAGHRSTGERVVVVANLTSTMQAFRFASAGAITGREAARISIIDESTVADYRSGLLTTSDERLDDRERRLKPFACLIASY